MLHYFRTRVHFTIMVTYRACTTCCFRQHISIHSSWIRRAFCHNSNLSSPPSLVTHHSCHLTNPLRDVDIEGDTFISPSFSSDDESSISSTDSPRRGWYLEEWSDDEILQDLDDLQDFEFLNKVLCVKNDRWNHKCLNQDEHVRQMLHEDSFENEDGMSLN